MALRNYSYIGRGPVYARERGTSGGLLPIGNVSALEFSAEEERVTQPDYTSAGGGLANSVTQIGSVTGSMTALDISPENLARAARGLVNRVAGGDTVTGEQHEAYQGALISFAYLPDLSDADTTLTVTIDPEGAAAEAVQGEDYELTRAGITITEGGAIEDGTTISVAYAKSAAAVVEALTKAGAEYELVFDGLNAAQSGKAVRVTAHRVKFSPFQGLGFIADEFGELAMNFDVLSEPTIQAADISKFFKVDMAE